MNAEDFFVVYDFVPEHSRRYSRYWQGYIDRAYFDTEKDALYCAEASLYDNWEGSDFDLDKKQVELREHNSVDLGDYQLRVCKVAEFKDYPFYPAMLAEAVKEVRLALPHLR